MCLAKAKALPEFIAESPVDHAVLIVGLHSAVHEAQEGVEIPLPGLRAHHSGLTVRRTSESKHAISDVIQVNSIK